MYILHPIPGSKAFGHLFTETNSSQDIRLDNHLFLFIALKYIYNGHFYLELTGDVEICSR